MNISFGDVLLARFPYTDLTSDKRRPVVVLSAENGLKTLSRGQFDKVATLDRSVVSGRLGVLPRDFLNAHQSLFFGLFGFDRLG